MKKEFTSNRRNTHLVIIINVYVFYKVDSRKLKIYHFLSCFAFDPILICVEIKVEYTKVWELIHPQPNFALNFLVEWE